MATITKTIRNTVRLYGVEPHNRWGALVWGTDTWAQQDVQVQVHKFIPLSISLTFQNAFKVRHLVSEAVILSTIISRQIFARTSNNVSITSRIASVYRVNNGWYVQRFGETNLLNLPANNFVEVPDLATSWTPLNPTSTTWVTL